MANIISILRWNKVVLMSLYYYAANTLIQGLSEFGHEKTLAKAHKIIMKETFTKSDKFSYKQLI
jgi:hypothetical protein